MLQTALILGLLSAVGPVAIDMYLPAMPKIAAGLGADEAKTQLTLAAYFAAFGVAQLIYGPWSDQAGRKLPLYTGLTIFVVASIGCALSPTISWLIAFRILQGFGGAVLMVLPRAVIRDMHAGPDAMRLMAVVMLVISVSPMLAPLAGSVLLIIGDWRLIFWVLGIAAGLSLLLTVTALPETLPLQRRVRVNPRTLWSGSKTLFRDPIFMGLTLVGGVGFAGFMVFIATAAFVYSEQFGLGPMQFSLAFALNAVGFFAAGQLAGPLSGRIGMPRVIRWAAVGFAGVMALLLGIALAGKAKLAVNVAGLFLGNACLGVIVPTTMVMALDPHGENAGLASSLGGTLHVLSGAVIVVLTGLFFDGTALPMIAAIALCALLALAVALVTLRSIDRSLPVGSRAAQSSRTL